MFSFDECRKNQRPIPRLSDPCHRVERTPRRSASRSKVCVLKQAAGLLSVEAGESLEVGVFKERQFRVFSIAVLALVGLICMNEKRAATELESAQEIMIAEPAEDVEVRAIEEIEEINAHGFKPYLVGDAQPIQN